MNVIMLRCWHDATLLCLYTVVFVHGCVCVLLCLYTSLLFLFSSLPLLFHFSSTSLPLLYFYSSPYHPRKSVVSKSPFNPMLPSSVSCFIWFSCSISLKNTPPISKYIVRSSSTQHLTVHHVARDPSFLC